MPTTTCIHCSRVIAYGGATICPFCGKSIPSAAAPSRSAPVAAVPPSASRIATTNTLTATATPVPSSAVATADAPKVPAAAAPALGQLRDGIRRLLEALDEGRALDAELALGHIAVAVAVLRASDRWDIADAGLQAALREFLEYQPAADSRGNRVRALQDMLRRLLKTAKPDATTPSPTFAQPVRRGAAAAMLASPTSLLARIDEWAFEDLDLHRLLSGPIAAPTVYCETFEEFFASFYAFQELSPEEQARSVQLQAEAARQSLEDGGGAIFGVNWPGHGCFLNGEAFAQAHDKGSAAEALRCPETFPRILATAVHEKLGHGLLAECTARGRDLRSVHLEQHEVARQFLRRKSDDPRHALLEDKWTTLLVTSKYSEEGFATWMESHTLNVARRRIAAGETVDEPVQALESGAHTYPAVEVVKRLRKHREAANAGLADAIEFLAQAGPDRRDRLIQLMSGELPHTELQAFGCERDQAFDALFGELFGQPMHYVVGYVLVEKLQRKFGARSVPFALALAGNVAHGLETISNSDLRIALETTPMLRMDVRLAALGTLEGVERDDPEALFAMARRELSMTPPQLLPRKERS